jgi:hypothetical protein
MDEESEYKALQWRPGIHLPGRGVSMIQKVDGLEKSAPLHFGPGDSSIFLREAYTS